MLTENNIVDSVTLYLKDKGFEILQSLTTNEKGIDIIAEKNGGKLYVEAKGETSSKAHTKRFGKPFTKNQIKSHVSRAILTSLQILSSNTENEKIEVAIALPDTKLHRELIDSISYSLQKINIKIFWVNRNTVTNN